MILSLGKSKFYFESLGLWHTISSSWRLSSVWANIWVGERKMRCPSFTKNVIYTSFLFIDFVSRGFEFFFMWILAGSNLIIAVVFDIIFFSVAFGFCVVVESLDFVFFFTFFLHVHRGCCRAAVVWLLVGLLPFLWDPAISLWRRLAFFMTIFSLFFRKGNGKELNIVYNYQQELRLESTKKLPLTLFQYQYCKDAYRKG